MHNKLGETDLTAVVATEQPGVCGASRFTDFHPRIIFAGKTDVKSTFRVVPLKVVLAMANYAGRKPSYEEVTYHWCEHQLFAFSVNIQWVETHCSS